jgi:hypothetical protein
METAFPRDKASRGADPAQLGKAVWGVFASQLDPKGKRLRSGVS